MSGTAIYNLLGIEPNSTQEEIKSAYRAAAKERHPDHNPDDPEAADRFAKVKKAYDLLSDEAQRRDWHKRYGLVWLWAKEPEPQEERPPADLNWACAACEGKVSYRCSACQVGMCPHFTIMVTLSGYAPHPTCVDCKRNWNDKKHAKWRIQQIFRDRF